MACSPASTIEENPVTKPVWDENLHEFFIREDMQELILGGCLYLQRRAAE
ncbi:hypothetical protein HMPREF0281_01663 [Corynebacterium ammoniagenes DSM 20306]|uniref:Uncharacterized protein n=1 Tax=Corynebacterium ammoniagenes DSM 20306 TaxID=649754 RepID=A0ABN0AE92_CORAM|nr:hypothetical protein HMPREF0281_01663 [Corynebacterium ammoniagenes DSM 20306]